MGRRDCPPVYTQRARGSADVQVQVFAYMIYFKIVCAHACSHKHGKLGPIVCVCLCWGWGLHAGPTAHEPQAEQITPFKRHDFRASLPFFKISTTTPVQSSLESYFFEEIFYFP